MNKEGVIVDYYELIEMIKQNCINGNIDFYSDDDILVGSLNKYVANNNISDIIKFNEICFDDRGYITDLSYDLILSKDKESEIISEIETIINNSFNECFKRINTNNRWFDIQTYYYLETLKDSVFINRFEYIESKSNDYRFVYVNDEILDNIRTMNDNYVDITDYFSDYDDYYAYKKGFNKLFDDLSDDLTDLNQLFVDDISDKVLEILEGFLNDIVYFVSDDYIKSEIEYQFELGLISDKDKNELIKLI